MSTSTPPIILPTTVTPPAATLAPTEPIIVSYSELDTFRQCPFKHYLAYVLRYTQPTPLDGPLAKGSLWHLVMETHYNRILEFQQTIGNRKISLDEETALLEEIRPIIMGLLFDPKTGAALGNIHELIWWMYEGYVAKYGVDRQWRVIATEHSVVTPLRDKAGRRTRYHFKAKIDLIVFDRPTGNLWVVDHKSGQNLPSDMDLEIDDQFGLYAWAMREMGKSVQGAIHSAVRTQRNMGDFPNAGPKNQPQTLEQRMKRTYLNRSEVELTNLAFDAYMAAYAAYPPKGGVPARYSSPDPRQCGWKCNFKEAHIAARKGRPLEEVLNNYGFTIDKTRH